MPNLKRAAVRKLSQLNKDGFFKTTDRSKLDNRNPKLEAGCWYLGKVTGFNGERPVVFQNSSNPVVILNGCREPVEIGQQVIYEVTSERPTYYLGDFKEVYRKENGV